MVPIKGRLVSPEFTTLVSSDVAARLSQCLASDASHIPPSSPSGDYIKAIQDALNKVGAAYPELGLTPLLVPIKDTPGDFGQGTTDAVTAYKSKRNIVRPGQPLDDIVGRGTISQLDTDLVNRPQPKPTPPPAPPPVLGVAGVNIANVGPQRKLIEEYYRTSGRETIGPAQIATSTIQTYSTFEEMIDILLTRLEIHQVIVNHGENLFGLHIKICRETNFKDTGAVVPQMSALADAAEKGPIDQHDFMNKTRLNDCQHVMSVKRDVVLRLVNKLVLLRKKHFFYHFRACNMPDEIIMGQYKAAFGALAITYHQCRLIFNPIGPVPFASGHSSADFPLTNNTDGDRARVFTSTTLPTLVIAAIDRIIKDKKTHRLRHVDGDFSFVEQSPIGQGVVTKWAEALVGRWNDPSADSFVVPMMWDSGETIFHCPVEEGWRKKLKVI